MKERRRYKRFSVLIPLKVQKLYSERLENTITKNISQGGIRIKSSSFFLPKERIKIILNTPVLNTVNGKIVWIKKEHITEENSFEVGIEFIEVDSYLRKIIFLKFLNFNF